MDAPRATRTSTAGPGSGAPGPRDRHRTWHRWGPTLAVALVCLAVLGGWRWAFFDDGHPVVDHLAYEAQAQQLVDGRLFLPEGVEVPEQARQFTAPTESGGLFKYLPGTAALGAVSLWLSDGFTLALGLTALGLVVATSGVAGTLGWSPWRRAVAAGLVGASPVVLSNGSVLLSYLPALALGTAALWMVLAATGAPGASDDGGEPVHGPGPESGPDTDRATRSVALAGGAGLVLGAALTVRQLDVVAWIAVLTVWCAVAPGRPPKERGRRTGAFLLGLLPGVLAVLVLDHTLTGSALELPFTVVSPADGIGWGERRVLPGDALETFSLLEGLRAMPRALLDLALWTLAGLALVAGAGVALWLRRRSPVHLLLAALAVVVPLAYLFHWANAHAVQAGFYMEVGPFYLLPCVVPLVLLGVDGLASLPRRAVVAMVAVVLVVQAAFLVDHLSNRWDLEHATGPARATVAATVGVGVGVDVHGEARTH